MTFPTTRDAIFDGALALVQPARGHRAGTDAVLLAASCPPQGATIVDLGCGVGTVGLRVAQVMPQARVLLVDNNPDMLALADMNLGINGLAARCATVAADVLDKGFATTGALERLGADIVLTNPPFAEAGQGRASPDPLKASAHVMAGTLEDWIRAALRLMTPQGDLIVIHRGDALTALLSALDRRFGNIRIIPVHPAEGGAASRILVRASRASRAPLRLLPALVLHGPDGRFTERADAIHKGTASILWE